MSQQLADVEPGDRFEIVTVPDGEVRAQLLRIGFLDGLVECRTRIRNGPVVLAAGGTEIALGASVAESIEIEPV